MGMELLTIAEVADKLKTNKNRVYELIKKGHLQALKLGSYKIVSVELERFMLEGQGKDYTDLECVKDLKIS